VGTAEQVHGRSSGEVGAKARRVEVLYIIVNLGKEFNVGHEIGIVVRIAPEVRCAEVVLRKLAKR
jgi:hypothetical protein